MNRRGEIASGVDWNVKGMVCDRKKDGVGWRMERVGIVNERVEIVQEGLDSERNRLDGEA